ncbi:hypothetical protein KBC04_02570 [Candidatus Babeliales bacterium]|nr:hypothetical protein [Candidatus Babeliales bacterium]MBP9844064.1 hypothetical protein [Candidatus Babeliales bacterium]
MKQYIFFIICCLFFNQNNAQQFIYPVADFENGNQLMVIYQKSLEDVELWIWDATDHYAVKGLSSFLIPANLRILPSGKGFSFIDRGYIKIKEFEKRSARTLPIYEPIGLFSNMNWINEDSFYFVAREGDFFQIFQSDLEANIQRLTYDCADALYPQKTNYSLFYIKRDQNNQFSIIRTLWNPVPINSKLIMSIEDEVIIEGTDEQLCFLKIIDDQKGFFIKAPLAKTDNNSVYLFSCYHLFCSEKKWVTKKLFDFKIPAQYITGLQRLYESIEPFLPNYTCKNLIYFVDWNNKSQQFDLSKFDILQDSTEIITNKQENLYRCESKKIFAPYIHKSKIHCGLILENERNFSQLFQKKFTTENVMFELITFDQK